MPKPPIDPESLDKVNFVIDSWTTGCDAPWYVYVETMKPAALTAFITLITFGMDDVFRGFFRPRGLRGRRTGKRKGKWSRRIPRFPEVGELIGSKIPGATEVKGKRWSILSKTLWRIDTVMQQAFFYWLVVDVVEDFVFDWTSLLYESYWCQDDPPGRFSHSEPGWSAIWWDSWNLAGFGVEDYQYPPPIWRHISGSTGDNPAMITAALSVKKHPLYPEPTSFQVQVRNDDTGEVYADSGVNDELVAGAGAGVATGQTPPNTQFRVVARITGTPIALYGDGVVIGRDLPP